MTERQFRVILAHPGRQHSFRTAEALAESGVLFRYVTTVYATERSWLYRLAGHFLKGDSKERAEKRKIQSVNDNQVVRLNEFLGYLLLLLLRIDKSRYFYTALNGYVRDSFGRKVARMAIKNKVDAVICYDANSTKCFELLKKTAPSIVRIIDHAHPPRNYLYEIYQGKMAVAGSFSETYEASGYILRKAIAEYFGHEVKLANYHVVASSFSKKALLFNDVKESQISVVPYGASDSFRNLGTQRNFHEKKLRVLFVGEINQRKGIKQILDCARELANKDIEFNLIGMGKEYKAHLYKPYEPYVNFHGRVSFDDLCKFYDECHIFIFPSMGEGFGLVILEAMSAGLPVIASKNCAGPDIIHDGENGFLIEAGSTEQLSNKIIWYNQNRKELEANSERARKLSERFTWSKYRAEFSDSIIKILS